MVSHRHLNGILARKNRPYGGNETGIEMETNDYINNSSNKVYVKKDRTDSIAVSIEPITSLP
jgi:hypothetical protein